MADLVVSGSGGGSATFSEPVAYFDTIAGAYWDDVRPGGPEYRIEKLWAGATAGSASKRHNFKSRMISARVIYVGASRADCLSDLAADEAIFNQPCSVATPGGATYPACETLPYDIVSQPKKTEYGTYIMIVDWTFEQNRES